jgi:lysine-specific demethylase 8
MDLAGQRTVPIELGSKYTDQNWSQQLMTIEEFIRSYVFNEGQSSGATETVTGYLAQHPLFDQVKYTFLFSI